MKKIITILIMVLILSLCFILCSCTDDIQYDKNYNDKGNTLVMVESGMYGPGYYYYIAYDRNTKVMYMVISGGGCTVMLDKNGKPLIYKGAQIGE